MKQKFRYFDLVENENVLQARRERLKQAREKAGQFPEQLCMCVGNSDSAYCDLENYNNELNMCISLGELSNLASTLKIYPRFIFDGKSEPTRISIQQLSNKIKSYLTEKNLTIENFEKRVGFVISPALENPSEILNWNIDCLRFVCAEIGINWFEAIP